MAIDWSIFQKAKESGRALTINSNENKQSIGIVQEIDKEKDSLYFIDYSYLPEEKKWISRESIKNADLISTDILLKEIHHLSAVISKLTVITKEGADALAYITEKLKLEKK